jgi:hypothetical protein
VVLAINCAPVPFNDVHQVIRRHVRLPNSHVHIAELVLAENCLDLVLIDIRQRNCIGDCDAALVLLVNQDGWRLFIQANSKALQLALDDLFVPKRLEDIQNNENEITCASNWGSIFLNVGFPML